MPTKPTEPVKPKVQQRTQTANTLPVVTTNIVIDEPLTTTPNVPMANTTDGEEGPVNNSQNVAGSDVVTIVNTNSTPVCLLVAEIMPEYEEGVEAMMHFLRRNMRYPASARRMLVEGTVYVGFVVSGDGSVTDVKVIRGIHPDCDKEAMRVISKMPKWKGGKQGGIPVPVRMVLPIKFKLA
jgi:protein TonB